jgi:hypothetical protein
LSTPRHERGFKLIPLVVIGADCTGSCKSNYHMIMSMTAPSVCLYDKPSDPCEGRCLLRYLSQVNTFSQWGQGWECDEVAMWCSKASGEEYLFIHLVHWKCLLKKKKFKSIKNTFIKLEKVDLVITDTPAFQSFIQKPLKSLSSKRKRAIIHER